MRSCQPTGAEAQAEIQTVGRSSICQCEIRAAPTLWRTGLHCCFRKWSGGNRTGSSPSRISIQKCFNSRGDTPIVWNRQLLFFIYILAGSAGTKLQSLLWFAEGLMKRWAKTQLKPQLHSAPRTHTESGFS